MELTYIFLGNILFFFVVYTIGSLLLYPFNTLTGNDNPYGILAQKLFFGVLGSITVFSLVSAHFLSINLIFLLIYAFSVWHFAAKGKTRWNLKNTGYFSDIRKLPYFIPVFLIAIGVGLFKFHYFTPDNYVFAHNDNAYYLQVARFMPVTHLENFLPWNALITGFKSALSLAPYHYGDLWLTSFCISVCSFLLPMVAYLYVLTPFLIIFTSILFTCIIQSLPIAENKAINFKFLSMFFCNDALRAVFLALVGFLFAMYWGYTPKIPLGFIHTVSTEPKIFNFIFPVAFAVFCYLQGKKILSCIALSSVAIFDFVYFPFFSIGLLIFLFFLRLKKNRTRLSLFLFFIMSASGMFILLFYYLTGSLFIIDVQKQGINFAFFEYTLDSLLIIVKSLYRHIITCFPLYFILFFIIKNKKQLDDKMSHIAFFLVGIIVLSFLLVGFGHFHHENWQFSRAINPATAILLMIFLAVDNNVIPFKKLWLILFCIVSLQGLLAVFSQSTQPIKNGNYPYISDSTISRISHFLEDNNAIIAYFADNIKHPVAVTYYDYNFAGFLKKDVSFVEINLPDEVADSSGDQHVTNLKLSPFFEYLQVLKQSNSYAGVKDAQLKFLENQNIDFVLLSATNYPGEIKRNAVDSLLFDSGSSLKLYKIKF